MSEECPQMGPFAFFLGGGRKIGSTSGRDYNHFNKLLCGLKRSGRLSLERRSCRLQAGRQAGRVWGGCGCFRCLPPTGSYTAFCPCRAHPGRARRSAGSLPTPPPSPQPGPAVLASDGCFLDSLTACSLLYFGKRPRRSGRCRRSDLTCALLFPAPPAFPAR